LPGRLPVGCGPFFNGKQTGQSVRVQNFQWVIICLDDAQWATEK